MNTHTLPRPWRFALDRHDDPQPVPTPAPAATDPAPEPATDPAADPADDAPLGPAGEKALTAMKERARAAEAAQKALEAKVREFEDRDKTELQRAQEAATRFEAEARAAQVELNRTRILADHGLGPADAEFLPTGTEEEMQAAAKRLADRFAASAPARAAGPRPDPSQGSGRPTPAADWRTASPQDFAAEMAKHGLRPRR